MYPDLSHHAQTHEGRGMTIRCCVCKRIMGTKPGGPDSIITDGYCDECKEALLGVAHRAEAASPDLNPFSGGHEVEPDAVEEPCLSGNGARPRGKEVTLKATATEYRGAVPFSPLTLAGGEACRQSGSSIYQSRE